MGGSEASKSAGESRIDSPGAHRVRGADVRAGAGKEWQDLQAGTWRSDIVRSAAVGFGSVAAGVAVFCVWGVIFGFGSSSSDGDGGQGAGALAITIAWLAVPCAFVCWGLALLSLRRTWGVRLDGRLLSVVLWTLLSPSIWGVGASAWEAWRERDEAAAVWGVYAAGFGTALWCLTLTPIWVALLVRGYLRRHPATRPDDGAPAVYGRAEAEEDAEVARQASS